jgi:ATP-dependent Zn protease
MAGRAAERLLLGRVSCGAGGSHDSDLSAATRIAAALERSYGLGESGPVWFGPPDTVADQLRTDAMLRDQVQQRLQAAEAQATELLRAQRSVLREIAEALYARSVLSEEDLDARLAGLE